MTTQPQQLLTIILPTESLESAAAHEKPESLTHQEYCVLSGFFPHHGISGIAPRFYREATLRGIVEVSEATMRYLDALKERGIIFGYRMDSTAQGDTPPTILPEDIIKTAKNPHNIEGSAKAELAFDPDCFAYAEEPNEETTAVGFLWEEYAQQIIDHIAKRAVTAERARNGVYQ
jgi:hypothetical protein